MENLDLRVQKTYKSLIQAFESLLHEKDFEQISVTELCDAAIIRRPTFYAHFLDKYDFLTFFIKHKMNLIFNNVFQKLDHKENDFFILVFEELLNQHDHLLDLIFNLQMNSDIMKELEGIQEYGQKILRNHVNENGNKSNIELANEYKAQIIMGTTIQSVYWYKNNRNKITLEEMILLYKETLEKL